MLDFNKTLFCCNEEERESGVGGVYNLDGYGPLSYAGLQGFVSILSKIRPTNDLGNWLPANLRQGDWMMDYISSRLLKDECGRTKQMGTWFQSVFEDLKKLPRYLIPSYFDVVINHVYCYLLEKIW